MPAGRSTAAQGGDDRSLPPDPHARHQGNQEKHQGKRDKQEGYQPEFPQRTLEGNEFQLSEEGAKDVYICQATSRGIVQHRTLNLIIYVSGLLGERRYVVRIKTPHVKRIAQEENKGIRKSATRKHRLHDGNFRLKRLAGS